MIVAKDTRRNEEGDREQWQGRQQSDQEELVNHDKTDLVVSKLELVGSSCRSAGRES